MGFFSSFFGSMAANAQRERREREKQEQEYEQMIRDICDIGIDFNGFLMNYNIGGLYIGNRYSLADEGRSAINAEKRRVETYKRKINEYINMGGHPSNILNYENIDDYLTKLKFIKSVGYLDRQDDWIHWPIDDMKTAIQNDIQVRKMYKEALAKKAEQEQREKLVQEIGADVFSLSGVEFENVCQALVEKMGFTTESTKASGDGGIDIIAYNHQPLLSGKYIIQCKRYSGSVGEPILRDLYGVVTSERANKGILMTTGYFTQPAISFSENKPLELIDGARLKELIEAYLV